MTANEKRQKVADAYKIILGRNIYNQDLRDYCYNAYKDGKYYSDCSSSISYAYKKAGYGFGILNTASMYTNLSEVKGITIKNGIPTDISKLRVGDMFLFAGSDASRPMKIGHVEMVYSINGNTVTLCGHGSNTPSLKNMKDYCTYRYNQIASGGWRKGLVVVKRYIQDDINTKKVKNGWINNGSNWQYYDNGVLQKNRWVQSDKTQDWYYLDDFGNMAVNKWVIGKNNADYYYVDENGKMLKSISKYINGYEQYFDSNGKWIKYTGWNNNRYYPSTNSDHAYVRNSWVQDESTKKWYWCADDGKKVVNTWAKDKKGLDYYLGSDGAMVTNSDVIWKGKPYHLAEDGHCTNSNVGIS